MRTKSWDIIYKVKKGALREPLLIIPTHSLLAHLLEWVEFSSLAAANFLLYVAAVTMQKRGFLSLWKGFMSSGASAATLHIKCPHTRCTSIV